MLIATSPRFIRYWVFAAFHGVWPVISGAWKAGAKAEPHYHADMCCQAFFRASFWFFLMPKGIMFVSVSRITIKDLFCKHDGYLRSSMWQTASCTEIL